MSAFPNLRPTDIMSAVEENDREKLLAALERYPLNVDREVNGNTALQVAARMGNIGMIQCLVHAKADVNYCDNNDKTPLHYAVLGDRPEAVDLLLKLGCSMYDEMESGETAPQIAFARNYSNCVRVFLERDPRVKLKSDNYDEQSSNNEVEDSEESIDVEMKEKCMYCKEEDAIFTFEPCGHKISCLSCSIPNAACIYCGEAIEKISYCDFPEIREFIKQMEDKKKEIEKLKEERKCFICRNNPIDCTLMCGHLFCIECVRKRENPTKNEKRQQIWKCFVCDKPSRFLKVYGMFEDH